jgi:hypothetical protein
MRHRQASYVARATGNARFIDYRHCVGAVTALELLVPARYFPRMAPRIMPLAIVATLVSASIADAATCLPSPAAVRKQQPKAWPQWTRGPQGQRCWFAGRKTALVRGAARLKPVRPAAPKTKREWDFQNDDPIWQQPWSVEHRWPSTTGRSP